MPSAFEFEPHYTADMRPLAALLIVAASILSAHNCQALAAEKKPFLRRMRKTIAPFTLPWYEDGLKFDCTECGKCCRVDGDVWLAPEESKNIMSHLGYSIDDFRKQYIRAEVSPDDGNAQESWMCLKRNEGACIFLNPLGQCSIYEVRPIQCRTYPFWPSLLESRETWEEESVLPDDISLRDGTNDRHWTPELGGCEGIWVDRSSSSETDSTATTPLNDVNGDEEDEQTTIVERDEIKSKMRAAKKQWKRFPVQEIKESIWYL